MSTCLALYYRNHLNITRQKIVHYSADCHMSFEALQPTYVSSATTENSDFSDSPLCLIGQPPARISCVTSAHKP